MVDDLVDFWHTAGSASPLMLLDDRAREFLTAWEAKGYITIHEEVGE
jgi:hypothetical protein